MFGACAGDGFEGIQLCLGVCSVAGAEVEPHFADKTAGASELRRLFDLALIVSPVCDPPRMESHAHANVGHDAEAGLRGERVGGGDGSAEQSCAIRRLFERDFIAIGHAVEVAMHVEQALSVFESLFVGDIAGSVVEIESRFARVF